MKEINFQYIGMTNALTSNIYEVLYEMLTDVLVSGFAKNSYKIIVSVEREVINRCPMIIDVWILDKNCILISNEKKLNFRNFF